ncbi:P-loop containing nucleoside triphosphate hydrolase protein [Xylariomycetidae sp. FL2044]|nr:P-loop containing nucleoside triphosphate hydrolase protein [Xylariomycetidae sp. FL2044]
MDQFLLQNATLYQNLVKSLKPPPAPPPAKAAMEPASADMIVSARIRPLLDEDASAGFPRAVFPRSSGHGVVDIHDLYHHPRGRPVLKSFNYQVDKLFTSRATTKEIFDDLLVNLVPFAWDGGVGTLFAYGQTGSGKTFTISRLEQLVVESLMEKNEKGERRVCLAVFELAGNAAFDLLNARAPISILEDSFGVTQLAGAVEVRVQNRDEVMTLIERATSFRRSAPTFKNDASSRSHSICRIRIEDQSAGTEGFLYLVDLAGSEAARDVAVHGADRMRETREINMSLSVLKECIRSKAQWDALVSSSPGSPKSKAKKPHVPFRQSALTKVLKHVFDPVGGRATKTVVIACVNPSLADVGPSKNTLRYAELLRVLVPKSEKIETKPGVPMSWTNAQLKDWITKNSGKPPISASSLARAASGAQLLRLPAEEFEVRCRESVGVSREQARAFRSKLWQLHVHSQRVGVSSSTTSGSGPTTSSKTDLVQDGIGIIDSSCSKAVSSESSAAPFKERIRPGMVVSLSEPPASTSDTRLAVVLCPLEHSGVTSKSSSDRPLKQQDVGKHGGDRSSIARYVCALVTPGLTPEAYEVNLWRQLVVDVSMMEKEVFLEYDNKTRYYYMSI